MKANKGYYLYLCAVCEEMNFSFIEQGIHAKAIVVRDEDSKYHKYKIVVLKEER